VFHAKLRYNRHTSIRNFIFPSDDKPCPVRSLARNVLSRFPASPPFVQTDSYIKPNIDLDGQQSTIWQFLSKSVRELPKTLELVQIDG